MTFHFFVRFQIYNHSKVNNSILPRCYRCAQIRLGKLEKCERCHHSICAGCTTVKVIQQVLVDDIPIKVHGETIEHRRSTRSFGFTGRREHSIMRPSVLAPISEQCTIEFEIRLCFICKKDDEVKIRSLDWFHELKRKRFLLK